MNFIHYISVLGFLSISTSLLSQQQKADKMKWIELHGYIRDMQNSYFIDNIDSLSSSNLIHNRLNFKFTLSPKLTGRLEIRNRIFYGDQVKQIPEFGKYINQYEGFINLSKLWVSEYSLVIHSVVDRFQLQYAGEKWDIKIGRQRINWGINNIWNPNDIFNAYNFLDFDYEERRGNDAIRIQHFFKNNTAAELAFKPGRNKDESTGALLYKFNRWKYDFQFLTGICQSDLVIGTGWAGNIIDAGFKGEASYFHPKNNPVDTTGIWCLSIMSDMTFKNNWYVSLAVLYNSNPNNILGAYGGLYNSNLSAKSLFPYRYNFYAGIIKTITPITSINFSFIYATEKNTIIVFPSFAWNVASNFDLDFTTQSYFAESKKSYQTLGNAFFIRGRWSF